MHWIVQDTLYREESDLDCVRDTLTQLGCTYDTVSVRHGQVISAPPRRPVPTMILGGYTLMRYAAAYGITPGCYTHHMDTQAWMQAYGTHMLNHGAQIMPLHAVTPTGPFFLRPDADSKAFIGRTFEDADTFAQWRIDTIHTHAQCTRDTDVVVADLHAIHREVRFFIVDGTIITASAYKMHGALRTSPIVYPEEYDFVRARIAQWQPNRAFVMDIAVTDAGLKIVELNCINCAGFYESNIPAIITALDQGA